MIPYFRHLRVQNQYPPGLTPSDNFPFVSALLPHLPHLLLFLYFSRSKSSRVLGLTFDIHREIDCLISTKEEATGFWVRILLAFTGQQMGACCPSDILTETTSWKGKGKKPPNPLKTQLIIRKVSFSGYRETCAN